MPDAEYIIKSWRLGIDQKLNLLFGGQDISQGGDSEMEESRKKFSHFFCHKYDLTTKSMKKEL